MLRQNISSVLFKKNALIHTPILDIYAIIYFNLRLSYQKLYLKIEFLKWSNSYFGDRLVPMTHLQKSFLTTVWF